MIGDPPRLTWVRPARSVVRPGERASLRCRFAAGDRPEAGELQVSVCDLDREVATAHRRTEVPAAGGDLELSLDLPSDGPRGYHLAATWRSERGRLVASVRGALLSVEHWWQAPRMGFLAAFGPDETHPERIDALAAYHLTVVQFYDWMYRHYRYLPPHDVFEDGMGRTVSLQSVRRRLACIHDQGMAGLAYGAVYGAENEYADDNPDQVLRDAHGERLSLIGRFFITDVRPGPWRDRLLGEYQQAICELGFDAIHMDQYGAPKHAFDASGARVDLAAAFPGLIDEAAARVRSERANATVTFNAVNDWPVEAVAPADQAIVYIEVWPPHDRYRHLVQLVHRARAASGGKQVVLAAYLHPFHEGGPAADASALWLTAIIAAAGGHHLLLGEGDGVLRDPYYPNHGRLSQDGRNAIQQLYDHTAALHAYLFDGSAIDRSRTFMNGENPELVLRGAPAASEPVPGHVWTSVWERPDGSVVLNLIDLTSLEHDLWNAPRHEPMTELPGLALEVAGLFRSPRVTWVEATRGREPRTLPRRDRATGPRFELPPFTMWATVILSEDDPPARR